METLPFSSRFVDSGLPAAALYFGRPFSGLLGVGVESPYSRQAARRMRALPALGSIGRETAWLYFSLRQLLGNVRSRSSLFDLAHHVHEQELEAGSPGGKRGRRLMGVIFK